MSGRRFRRITSALRFTSDNPLAQRDRFWLVRPMIAAWNKQMFDMFAVGVFVCVDESMSKWLGRYTCPGWMVVPWKPWPDGNEYHTACCCICGILFALEIVEGKDRPRHMNRPLGDEMGKTVGLLLLLTRKIQFIGRIVILDNGFCVIKALVELYRVGIFASALIKKRRYWPKHVNGDAVAAHFDAKELGSVDSYEMVIDDQPVWIFGMKDDGYVM